MENNLNEPDFASEADLIAALPHLPRVSGKPVFAESWEVRTFALALQLSKQGHFTWQEWVTALSAELKAAADRGEPVDRSHYYRHWQVTLERLVAVKGLVDPAELIARKETIATAQQETPKASPST